VDENFVCAGMHRRELAARRSQDAPRRPIKRGAWEKGAALPRPRGVDIIRAIGINEIWVQYRAASRLTNRPGRQVQFVGGTLQHRHSYSKGSLACPICGLALTIPGTSTIT
jgi:hypothetical protein